MAGSAEELAAHFDVRRRVFVDAQKLFSGSDRDGFDDADGTLHVIARLDDEIVGAVRLYPLGAGVWKGDRLAVLPTVRDHRLGALLVQFAVRAAGARGGARMVAQVQLGNVRFFERLGWSRDGATGLYVGVMHQPMAIPLGFVEE